VSGCDVHSRQFKVAALKKRGFFAVTSYEGESIPLFFIISKFMQLEVFMLVLTRRIGETLLIGDQIKVTVNVIRGNQVQIGIDAPRDISVHREEIYEKIKREEKLS